MKSVICELIRSNKNWQEIMESLCIKVKIQNNLAIFNYDIDADFSNSIVQEARGIIIDLDTLKVVCWPFRKFGNWQESYVDEIDWSTARVQEKIDGSIIKLYYYNDQWNWATNGMINAKDANCSYLSKTFLDSIKDAINYSQINFESLNKNYTYIFELVTPDNKIVIDYKYNKLFHLGTRNNENGEEYNIDIGIEKPKEYALTSFEEAIDAAANLNKENGVEHEGFVVVDGNWHRIKIKTQEYINIHHVINNHILTKKKMIEYILEGGESLRIIKENVPEYKHVIMYYEYKLEELKYNLFQFIRYAQNLYKEYSFERKAVVKQINGHPFMAFAMRNLDNEDVDIEKEFNSILHAKLIDMIPDYKNEGL